MAKANVSAVVIETDRSTPSESAQQAGVEFPIATMEINATVAGTDIAFAPRGASLRSGAWLGGTRSVRCGVGISIG